MVISPLVMRRFACAFIALVMLSAVLLAWNTLSHQDATLAIRPVNQGAVCLTVFLSGIIWMQTASALKASPRRTMFY